MKVSDQKSMNLSELLVADFAAKRAFNELRIVRSSESELLTQKSVHLSPLNQRFRACFRAFENLKLGVWTACASILYLQPGCLMKLVLASLLPNFSAKQLVEFRIQSSKLVLSRAVQNFWARTTKLKAKESNEMYVNLMKHLLFDYFTSDTREAFQDTTFKARTINFRKPFHFKIGFISLLSLEGKLLHAIAGPVAIRSRLPGNHLLQASLRKDTARYYGQSDSSRPFRA